MKGALLDWFIAWAFGVALGAVLALCWEPFKASPLTGPSGPVVFYGPALPLYIGAITAQAFIGFSYDRKTCPVVPGLWAMGP